MNFRWHMSTRRLLLFILAVGANIGCLEPMDLDELETIDLVADTSVLDVALSPDMRAQTLDMGATVDLDGQVDRQDGSPSDASNDSDTAPDASVQAPDMNIQPICGDGILAPTEQCDDGDNANDDGCKADCNRDTCGAYPRLARHVPAHNERGRSIAIDTRQGSLAILTDTQVQVEGGGGLVTWKDLTIDATIFGKQGPEAEGFVYAGVSRMIMSGWVVITSAEAPLVLQRGRGDEDCVYVYELDARELINHPDKRLEKPVVRLGEWAVVAYGGLLFAVPTSGPAGAEEPCSERPLQSATSVSPLTFAEGSSPLIDGNIIKLEILGDPDGDGFPEILALSDTGYLTLITMEIRDGDEPLVSSLRRLAGPCGLDDDAEILDIVGLHVRQSGDNGSPLGEPSVAVLCRTYGDGNVEQAVIKTGRLTTCDGDLCGGGCCFVNAVNWTGEYTLDFSADHLSAGDVDGDGLTDLAAVGGSAGQCAGSLEVLLQSGISVRPFVRRMEREMPSSRVTIGTHPSAVMIADVRRSGDYDPDNPVIRPTRSEVIVVNAGNDGQGARCDQRHVEILSHDFEADTNQNGQGDRCEAAACQQGLGGPRCDEFIYTQVAAGAYHNCGIVPDAEGASEGVRCWGDESLGFLNSPQIGFGERAVSVAATEGRTCVIINGQGGLNRTQCWPGEGWSNQFNGEYSTVSLGESFACGLNQMRGLECVAEDNHHPTGADQNDAVGEPPMDVIEVQRISVADNHACWLIENGGSGCWGNRLAPSNVSLNARPAGLIDGGAPLPLRSIVAGSSNSGAAKLSFACGLTTSGLAACWGDGFQAQFVPPNGTLFHDIAADDWTACGVAHDGRVHCWGGHAGLVDDAPPGLYKSISVGSGHACALTQMGTVRCWGNGGHPREDLPACEPDDENCEPHAAEVRTGRNETPTPPT